MICQYFEQYVASRLISNIRIGNISFGVTRMGTIFEVSATILKFLLHLKTNFSTLQMFYVYEG